MEKEFIVVEHRTWLKKNALENNGINRSRAVAELYAMDEIKKAGGIDEQ